MKKLSLLILTLFCAVGMALAQRTVSGVVTDSGGEALIGADVYVENSTLGTVTDFDGSFSIDVPEGTTQLLVSYIGYQTQNVDITSGNDFNISLVEGEVLDEVVVTAGGLERNKARIGYALQNVDAEELVAAKQVNLVDALNGKATGVAVTSSSGSPGASSNIIIRGATSINGTNSPLFVVDGIPIDNSEIGNGTGGVDQSNRAIDINPNDIADMTILKGPSATALYGVRAANGAIVITTKKGKAGKPKVEITASYSADRANKFPERQSTYAQGTNGVYRDPSTAEGGSWGPKLTDLEYDNRIKNDYDTRGLLVPKGKGTGEPAIAFDPYTFFVTGNAYELNASVSGGTENGLNYYISGGRLTSSGIVPNATFNRNTFRVNVGTNITERLSVGMNMGYTQSGGNRIQRGSNIKGVMLGLLRNTPTFDIGNGKEGRAAADDVSSYIRKSDDGQRSYRAGVYDNPYWTVNKNPSSDDVNRVIGSLFSTYKITDALSFGVRAGVDTYTDRRNFAIDINPGRDAGSVGQRVYSNRDINGDAFLSYNSYLTDDLSLAATVGLNAYDHDFVSQGADGTTLAAPNFYHISNASDVTALEGFAKKRLYGAYGTFDFGFKDFAFLNLTGRNDWSSILPVDNNTFQSYSAALGLVLTELFEIDRNILDYAKLRASYGKVGNDGGDAFIYATTNTYTSTEINGDGFISEIEFPAYSLNSFERSTVLANPNLQPEATTVTELGGEFKFLKGRLGLDVNHFDSRSSGQIIEVTLSAATGYESAIQNTGDITSKGWEISLTGTPVRKNDFEWNIGANYTSIKTVVESLTEGVNAIGLAGFTSTSAQAIAGQPFSAIYGDGFQRTDDGRVIVGSDGWPLASATKSVLGDPNPDFTLGLNNSFTYKGVTLSALLDIRQGGDVWCGTCGIIDYFGTSKQSADEREDVVVFDGVVKTGTDDAGNPVYAENTVAVPLATDNTRGNYRRKYGFGGISEMNIYDASWIRLRTVSLAYSLPASLFNNVAIGGARVSVTGRNLWLSTKYPGIDPETNLTGASNGYGLDYFNMPNTKGVTASVQLTF